MIRLEILRRKPSPFRSLTGRTIEPFERFLARRLPVWEQQERERWSRPDRPRVIGGGRKDRLSAPDMLWRTLMGLRQYWNTETLAFFFGVDQATVRRNTRRMRKALPTIGMESPAGLGRLVKGKGKRSKRTRRPTPIGSSFWTERSSGFGAPKIRRCNVNVIPVAERLIPTKPSLRSTSRDESGRSHLPRPVLATI